MDDDSKRKDPRVAGALALVGGPIGFLYLGWRYALAATVLFLALLMAFAFLLFAPPWLKYVNLPAFAFMAYTICERLNDLLERGQHRAVLEAKSLPVAVFALTSMLPLLAAFDSAVFGVATALPQLIRGDIGGGLMLLLAPVTAISIPWRETRLLRRPEKHLPGKVRIGQIVESHPRYDAEPDTRFS